MALSFLFVQVECNLQTRTRSQRKSVDHLDDVINQINLSRGIFSGSFNYASYQEVKNMQGFDFRKKWKMHDQNLFYAFHTLLKKTLTMTIYDNTIFYNNVIISSFCFTFPVTVSNVEKTAILPSGSNKEWLAMPSVFFPEISLRVPLYSIVGHYFFRIWHAK